MMIASKEAPQYKHLFPAVTSVVTSLVSSISPPAEQSLQLIQALLLLCNWPPPYGATIHDNSWTYCGLAVTYALRQGLHRPHHVSDFVYEAEFDEATMRERKKDMAGMLYSESEVRQFWIKLSIHTDEIQPGRVFYTACPAY